MRSTTARGVLISIVAVISILLIGGAAIAATSGGTGDATIGIASPGDGSQVSIPFEVTLESNVALGTPETGNHHAHLYFDTGTNAADYDIVYGDTWQVNRQLAPGEHTIIAALANPDHSLAGPTATITVVVGDVGSGGGSNSGGSVPSPSAMPVVPGY